MKGNRSFFLPPFYPLFFILLCQGRGASKGGGEELKRGEGPSRTLNRGGISLPGTEGLGSAVGWRGVKDKPRKRGKPAWKPKGSNSLIQGA
jgi:hypothetical protein